MPTLSLVPLLILVPVTLLVGVLIGSIGIGGVILVPAFHYIGGIDIPVAIAACMLSYAVSGLVGGFIYARKGSIRWSEGAWLCLGAMPGAYGGALTLSVLSADAIKLIIAVFIILAGINALFQARDSALEPAYSGRGALLIIGTLTGFGSAITGTGGPLLLVPILVWLKYPVLAAVGLGQIIQLPIAALATLGNWLEGRLDILLGLLIAACLLSGVAVGAKLAHQVPAHILKRVVASVLIAVGLLMVWQILKTHVSL